MGFWSVRKARPLLKLHHLMSKQPQTKSPHEKVTLTRNEMMCKTRKYYPKSKLSGHLFATQNMRIHHSLKLQPNFEKRTEQFLQPIIAHLQVVWTTWSHTMFKPFRHIWCIHENSSRFAVTDYILANINCQRFTREAEAI